MNVILTNLSNDTFIDSRLRLNRSARQFGIVNVLSFSDDDLKDTQFFYDNEKILSSPQGIGYWLWKPYIILEAFKKISKGDIAIYSDCGIEIISDLKPLFSVCTESNPIILFGNANQTNDQWTKRDCFVYMDCDYPEYWHGPHCDAAFSLWKKCDKSIKFLNDWLNYGTDERILTDIPNTCGKENFPEFAEHRRDQSILSLLAQKNKISLYRMPTQYGNHYKVHEQRARGEFNCVNQSYQAQVDYYNVIPYYNSNYPQLLNHHRTKKDDNQQNSKSQGSNLSKSVDLLKHLLQLMFGLTGYEIKKKSRAKR